MKSSNVILAVVGIGLLVVASQFANGQPAAAPMASQSVLLSKLEVGMRVSLVGNAPFSVVYQDEEAADAPLGNRYTITEIGRDYFVARYESEAYSVETTVALNAIGSIIRRTEHAKK